VGEGNTEGLNSNQAMIAVGAGFTVYFYKPAHYAAANVYYWNAQGAGAVPGVNWPGTAMTAAPEQGSNWYKFTFTKTISTNLIFNDNSGNQTGDLFRNKDGWYRDGKWYDQKPVELTIHFKKPNDWATASIHFWDVTPAGAAPNTDWPGFAMKDDGNGWYSYTIVGAECANIVFNNNNQGKQTGDLKRCGEGWYADGAWFDQMPGSVTIHFKKKNTWNTAYMHFWNVTPAGTVPNERRWRWLVQLYHHWCFLRKHGV
jgi:hypothetical protein